MIRVEAPNGEEAAMELVDSLKPVWFVPRQVLCRRWDAQLVDCELQKALLKLQYRCNFQPGRTGCFSDMNLASHVIKSSPAICKSRRRISAPFIDDSTRTVTCGRRYG
jgi:hypothetical protein